MNSEFKGAFRKWEFGVWGSKLERKGSRLPVPSEPLPFILDSALCHFGLHKFHQIVGVRAGTKYARKTHLLELWNVLIGNDAARNQKHIGFPFFLQELRDTRKQFQMCA